MKTNYAIIIMLGWVLVISPPVGAQEPLYASEDGVELYDAPNADANIIATLLKGTAVQVLETAASGYTRVHTPDNGGGWVSSQFLIPAQPSAPTETQAVPPTVINAQESGSGAKTAESAPMADEQLAAKSPADSVQAQLAAVQQELKAVREVNRRLKEENSLKWFVVGAAVLLLGFVIGLIVPKVQWRRKFRHTY